MDTRDYHTSTPSSEEGPEKPRFLDYVAVLMHWRRFILVNVVAVGLLMTAFSFLLPKWYKATASILPPKDQGLLNLFGGAGSVLKGLTSLPKLGGLNQSTGAYNYLAILKSRTAMESVVANFNLIDVYDVGDSSMEKAIKELRENTVFEYQDDDYITIDVFDKDPRRAAAMANMFVNILNTMSIELGTQEARNNREFIGQRLDNTRDSLRRVEDDLKKFQEKSGMMITPEQTSSISAFAELYAMKAKREIELAVLERTVTKDNPALQQIRLELQEIDRKVGTFPQTGLESFRLYRDVMTQQKILEVLLPLYEQAKINEQKDIPVLLVLDKAVPPEKKVRPQRILLIVTVSTLFLFFSVAAAFALNSWLRGEGTKPLELALQRRARWIAALYRIGIKA